MQRVTRSAEVSYKASLHAGLELWDEAELIFMYPKKSIALECKLQGGIEDMND